MSPEIQWLEDAFPIEIGDMLVFGGVIEMRAMAMYTITPFVVYNSLGLKFSRQFGSEIFHSPQRVKGGKRCTWCDIYLLGSKHAVDFSTSTVQKLTDEFASSFLS